ncbi:MAG: SDR family NAD(P)-dependent oxidoreductase [Neisseriaceae bacterium]|jgi:3-hydroxy acid dehydrogenase/malonic semialdehyde reductase
MQNLTGKIAVITGASSGIGEATAYELAKACVNLILVGRRQKRIEILAQEIEKDFKVKVLPVIIDVRDKNKVAEFVNNLSDVWKDIDILVNNAGLALTTDLFPNANTDNWDTMIDTNIKGLLYMTHAVLPNMIARNTGHIINISSIAGLECYLGGNVYSSTKHTVRAISKSLRLDLNNYNIRVSDIAPGAVNTEFSTVRWNDKERADAFYSDFNPLLAEDIADAILYCVTRKPHVNVESLVVMPTDQASATTINRGKL